MISREELYALVWAEPMMRVAERYDVSGTFLARVCDTLNVPRPPRGHWQKLAVGKAAPAEALPEVRPGDQVTWNGQRGLLPVLSPLRPARDNRQTRGPLRRVRKPTEDTHPLVRGSVGEFRRSRPSGNGGYLKPFKKLLPDVIASETNIERALGIASKLYNELEAAGARVVIAPGGQHWQGMAVDEREVPKDDRRQYYSRGGLWSPMRPTVALFQETPISIAVLEMSENVVMRYVGSERATDGYIRESEYQANPRRYRYDHSWTTNKDLPSGRFRIVASSAEGVKWSRVWQEKGTTTIDATLPRIAIEVRAAIPDVVSLMVEARRQAEIRQQEWLAAEDRRKREEDKRRIEDSTTKSREGLGEVIERWAERMAVERFLEELSRSIDNLPEKERALMIERLRLAREFMGTVNALEFFKAWRTPREIYTPSYDAEQ